jgi:hypothetical protein
LEISGNTTKYQEIQNQKHEILGNTLVFLRDYFSTWDFFIDWVLNYFILFTGIYEMSNRNFYEIPENTRKYFAKNMKYQEILENSRIYLEISGNT